jgi:ABC-2 type transport system permease protein
LTEGFIPFSGSSNLLSGAALLCFAVAKLQLVLPWWWVLSLVGNLVVTVSMIIGLSYLASSAAFYAPVQAEEISTYVTDACGSISLFPLSGMPLALPIPLISVLPTGLIAWFPTLALLGKPPLGLPAAFPLLFALCLAMVAAYFFQKGLNYYVQKGINRYSPTGHRR